MTQHTIKKKKKKKAADNMDIKTWLQKPYKF